MSIIDSPVRSLEDFLIVSERLDLPTVGVDDTGYRTLIPQICKNAPQN